MSLKGRDIISIYDLTRDEILQILELGKRMYEADQRGMRQNWKHELADGVLASLFYEPSTRTRQSFQTAMEGLGGRVIGFAGTEGTSILKGETIRDTIMMYCANQCNGIVMRHPRDGSLQWAADVAHVPVINGGDGKNEHPTQAILDLLTMYVVNEGQMNGLRVGLGGDLVHGRTIGSLTRALSHFENIEIHWAADDRLGLPQHLEAILKERNVNVIRHDTTREVLETTDFYYMTRPQMERMNGVTPEEILRILEKYRITPQVLDGTNAKVMHPLPIDSRLAEIMPEVAYMPNQVYYKQAGMGIFGRRALLKLVLERDGLNDYGPYDGQLPTELGNANNLLSRKLRENKADRTEGIIHSIRHGIVIDHLPGNATDAAIEEILHLTARSTVYVIAGGHFRNPETGEVKYVFKTDAEKLTPAEMNKIALTYPGATINTIEDGRVVRKETPILCQNDNCVTRLPQEAVPPRLYREGDSANCRYCRHPVEIRGAKISSEDRRRFLDALPLGIQPIQ